MRLGAKHTRQGLRGSHIGLLKTKDRRARSGRMVLFVGSVGVARRRRALFGIGSCGVDRIQFLPVMRPNIVELHGFKNDFTIERQMRDAGQIEEETVHAHQLAVEEDLEEKTLRYVLWVFSSFEDIASSAH